MSVKSLLKDATGELNSISAEVKELSQVHAELLKVEAEECADFIKKKVVTGVTLALLTFFLTCVLLTAGISALGILLKEHLSEAWQPFSWHLVAGAVSILLLILILIYNVLLRRKPQEAFFSQTKKELQNDKEWLLNLSKNRNENS